MATKSGLGACLAFSLLLGLTLGSCGRASPKDKAIAGNGNAGDPSCFDDECPGSGGAPGHAAGGAPALHRGGAPESGAPAAQGGAVTVEECEPGARSCDGPSVRVCSDDGQSSTIEETCSLSQICSEGACVDIACVPGATFCGDGQILECDEQGTGGSVVETCTQDQFCVEHDGVAECSATACVPKEGMCLNQVATTCRADGSGPAPGGTNCATQGLICDQGQCVDPTCTPGEKLCEHDDVYLCLGSGADAVLFTDCTSNEVCDPALAACRTRICEPGKLGCDSNRVATCGPLGLSWEQTGTDCETTNKICVEGACKAVVCVPSSTFCQDNNVYLCDANGVSFGLQEDCNDLSYHCAPYYYPNTAYCAYNACTPGTPVCSYNVLTKCAADGSGPEQGGTDCGSEVCTTNGCTPKLCEPNQYFCKDGDVLYCYPDGLTSYFVQDCNADSRCVRDATGVACVPYDCSPGLKACIANRVGVCADDGTQLGSVSQDCTATNQVCTSTTACGASAVDTLGGAEELQSLTIGYVFGDAIDVESNRLLLELEANLVLAAPRTLRWVVYELVGSYYEARYDKVVGNQSGSGYISSGPLSYTLKAGRKYLLGVAVSDGGFVPYYDAVPWQPEVSFGKALGGLAINYSTSLYYGYVATDRVYDLRITTELP